MKNVLKQFIKTKCEVIVAENEVTKAIQVLENNGVLSISEVGKYKWVPKTMWFVKFSATGKQMTAIKSGMRRAGFGDLLVITDTNVWAKVEKLI